MKSVVLCLVAAMFSACLWAQATPGATATPQAPATAPPPMHHHGSAMAGMHGHMQEMKAQVEKMRATVEQMKANLAKVKDSALKQQAQLDIDLWDAMVKHMEGMVSMMSAPGGMGMGGMQSGMGGMQGNASGMQCCKDMKEGGCCGGNKCMQPKAPPPATQSAPPSALPQ
jgi:hypothetical protein